MPVCISHDIKMAAPCIEKLMSRILVILTLFFLLSAATDSQNVPNYTADDFDSQLERGPHFILFYAPWCGHCKKTFPSWNALGERFNTEDDREVTIAKVDCSVESTLCSSHNIQGYPTMKFYHDAQTDEVYKGPRDVDSFESFVIRELKEREDDSRPDSDEPSATGGLYELTTDSFTSHTELGDHFVKFYAPWCGHCQKLAPTWAELAKQYETDQSLSIAKIDCVKEKEICQKYSIRAYPTMLWFRNGEQSDSYKGGRDLDSLKTYVIQKTAEVDASAQSDADKQPEYSESPDTDKGAVVSLDDKMFYHLSEKHGVVFVKFFVDWCGHCQALVPVYKQLAQYFSLNPEITIGEVDCTKYREICDKVDVIGFPTLILFRNGVRIEEYSGPRDMNHLSNFVTEHLPHDEL